MAPDVFLPLPGPLIETRFTERPNRFLLRLDMPAPEPAQIAQRTRVAPSPPHPLAHSPVAPSPPHPLAHSPVPPSPPPPLARSGRKGGRVVEAHLADPGRLNELLLPGRRVWVRYAAAPGRKTDWSAVLVETPDGQGLISVDTTLPNRLIHGALDAGALDEFDGWLLERREFTLGRSRIDFLLAGGDGRKLALEVKSVTLVEDGVALFPDAITARGARHVRELTEVAARDGWEAAILFVLQRSDARRILAARSIDPDFADALAEAKEAGVRVLGRRCHVSLERLTLGGPVPAS